MSLSVTRLAIYAPVVVLLSAPAGISHELFLVMLKVSQMFHTQNNTVFEVDGHAMSY